MDHSSFIHLVYKLSEVSYNYCSTIRPVLVHVENFLQFANLAQKNLIFCKLYDFSQNKQQHFANRKLRKNVCKLFFVIYGLQTIRIVCKQ